MSDLLPVIDIETTGLDAHNDLILEVAMAAVDRDLQVRTICSITIQHEIDIERVDPFVVDMHTKNGLWADVAMSDYDFDYAVDWLTGNYHSWFGNERLPMVGSSLRHDRHFLEHQMPTFHDLFHYRSIDVSTVKELAKAYAPTLASGWDKIKPTNKAHRASDDAAVTVEELRYYVRRMGWLPTW